MEDANGDTVNDFGTFLIEAEDFGKGFWIGERGGSSEDESTGNISKSESQDMGPRGRYKTIVNGSNRSHTDYSSDAHAVLGTPPLSETLCVNTNDRRRTSL